MSLSVSSCTKRSLIPYRPEVRSGRIAPKREGTSGLASFRTSALPSLVTSGGVPSPSLATAPSSGRDVVPSPLDVASIIAAPPSSSHVLLCLVAGSTEVKQMAHNLLDPVDGVLRKASQASATQVPCGALLWAAHGPSSGGRKASRIPEEQRDRCLAYGPESREIVFRDHTGSEAPP